MNVSKPVFFLSVVALAGCASSGARPETTAPVPPNERPAASAPAASAPAAPAAQTPAHRTATSPDGTKIAYEVTGSGPALMLVHGGGQTRRSWAQLGYVDRLSKSFTVVSLDLRGTGDSDKPVALDAYALDKQLGDLLAVADAAGAKQFHVWGFGYGGTLARHLAAQSDRVLSAVVGGATMGPAVTGVFKDAIVSMQTKWQPVIEAHLAGTLDPKTLSPSDRTAWENNVAVAVLPLVALLDFPQLEPSEIKAPTLWIVGTDDSAGENVKEYEDKLAGTQVTLKPLVGVNYSDSFVRFEQVLDEVEPFLLKSRPTT